MKKYLPFILLGVGVVTVIIAVFVIRARANRSQGDVEETALIDVVLNDRPVASLTPTEDGHWLKLKIEKLKIAAASLDYELFYELPDGRTQGVPGTIKLDGQESIERELLLGSESSGKFRYDEGVEEGTLTLRYRNDKGQLMVKFETQFRLMSDADTAETVDGKFSYTFDDTPDGYWVVMQTFGVVKDVEQEGVFGPYAVFASSEDKLPGKVEIAGAGKVLTYSDGQWAEVESGESKDIGYFVGASN